jgi:hypothetical protein
MQEDERRNKMKEHELVKKAKKRFDAELHTPEYKSDPVTLSLDSGGFIDKFQNLKDDGHIHFYYEDELNGLLEKYSFHREKVFYSTIRYPRPVDVRYERLILSFPKEITDNYHVELINEKVYIEVRIINALFRQTGNYPVGTTGNN